MVCDAFWQDDALSHPSSPLLQLKPFDEMHQFELILHIWLRSMLHIIGRKTGVQVGFLHHPNSQETLEWQKLRLRKRSVEQQQRE
jgi:hypothetical protein